MTGPASLTKVQNWGRVQLTYSLVKHLITHLRALETFHCGPSGAEDDDEVTETKIRAFLDEKALDLKKLQTPLYEQFYNSLNAASLTSAVGTDNKENLSNNFNLPPKSPLPSRLPSRRYSAAVDVSYTASTGSQSKRVSNVGGLGNQNRLDAQSPQLGEWKELILNSQPEPMTSASFSERQRKWKEELAEELERKRGFRGEVLSTKERSRRS